MLKTVFGPRTVAEAMIDLLNTFDMPDDQIFDGSGESMRRYGRRIIRTDYLGASTYERYPNETAAELAFEEERFPDEFDAMICESSGYNSLFNVQLEGISAGQAKTRAEAELLLARAMVDQGTFPRAWFCSAYGTYEQIDDEIRALHDDGGDQMRADLVES